MATLTLTLDLSIRITPGGSGGSREGAEQKGVAELLHNVSGQLLVQ